MTAAYVTLGCKVSQYETQAIRETLEQAGFVTVPFDSVADVYIVNSCTVTATGDKKSRQMAHRAKRSNPDAVVVLCGCFPQASKEAASGEMSADIVCGTTDRTKIPSLIEEYLQNRKRIVAVKDNIRNECYERISVNSLDEHTRAYIKIEDGCDRFCTYCLVPFARGNIRSRSLDDIHAEAERLINNGYKEFILTGINLSAYGKTEGLTLADAVDAATVNGEVRIRLGSLEPDLLTDEMIDRLAKNPQFCRQFHISLQSGSDTVLQRMNRHYTAGEYLDLVSRLRVAMPDCAITTDIMVGFPGETEEEFTETLDFVKKVGFASAHIFIYSRRKGTVADKMKDQIPPQVGKERSKRLFAAVNESKTAYRNSLIGKTVEVLALDYDGSKTKCIAADGTEIFINGEIKGFAKAKVTEVFDDRVTAVADE